MLSNPLQLQVEMLEVEHCVFYVFMDLNSVLLTFYHRGLSIILVGFLFDFSSFSLLLSLLLLSLNPFFLLNLFLLLFLVSNRLWRGKLVS